MLFESGRLHYRKPVREDFGRFWDMINDPVAKEYTGGVTRLSYRKRCELFIEECNIDFSPQGAEFAVIEKESDLYLGYCGFRYSEPLPGYEFLFGYCREAWGKGYATEAARAVLKYLFQTFPHAIYFATVDPCNMASKRVLEKAGFTRAGGFPINEAEPAEIYQLRKFDFISD